MTWNEFKAAVDAEMKEKGLSGDEKVNYIDVTMSNPDYVYIEYTPENFYPICITG